MRITFAHHLSFSYSAGGEQEIAQVAKELVSRGHKVTIYALPLMLRAPRRASPVDVLGDLLYKETWSESFQCDVAYYTYHPSCLVNFRTPSPKIAGFHSQAWFRHLSFSYGLTAFLAKTAFESLGKAELTKFSGVHVHNEQLVRRFAYLRKPVFPIVHPVDTGVFAPSVRTSNDKFTVLFCGRSKWQKGFDRFLNLAKGMENEPITFKWLGGWETYRNVETLGFTNSPKEVAQVMGQADLLVEPQRVGLIGRTALEALAVGTPVIAQADRQSAPSLPHLTIIENENELKDAVTAAQRGVRQYDPWKIHREIVSQFSVESVADKYEQMFNAVLDS